MNLPVAIRWSLIVLLVLGVLTGVAFAILRLVAMPVRDLPEPTGPHAVGTVSYDLVDRSREDPYSEPTRPRTIRVQLWYPAQIETTAAGNTPRRSPWMPDGIEQIRAIVRSNEFPFFLWDHTVRIRASAWTAAAVATANSAAGTASATADSLPIVIVSHGWGGYRGLHTDVAEELASYGYLVVAPEHVYGAAATLLDDGRLHPQRKEILPNRETTDRFDEFAWNLVSMYTADDAFVLDHLEAINAGVTPPNAGVAAASLAKETRADLAALLAGLAGRIDPSRVAAVGHSTGGGAVVALAMRDERVDVVVGLDAWVEPLGADRLVHAGYDVPSLFLQSGQWVGGINEDYLNPFVDRLATEDTPVALYRIEGITHTQFSTLHMYAPAAGWVGLLGETGAEVFADYQRRVVREFVDRHLGGGPSVNLQAGFATAVVDTTGR